MKKIVGFIFIFHSAFCILHSAFGKTWLVGPSRTYTMPSQVSTLVQNGDTVSIDAGVYNSDVARWTASNLLLKGSGGMAHLKANGNSYGGKAIWVISGNNTTVDSVEFSLCTVADHNGAGIRQEGINLTVRHCYFHDNQEGILAGDNITSDILIEYSEFYNNGYSNGLSHNLYINHVRSLTFQYNYTHHAHIGHELKSRAYNNYILYNRIANEVTGDASRNIDLPNGGLTIIIGNEIEQSQLSPNSNIIGYGLEGLTNPTPHELYLVNNTIVNDRTSGSFISVQNGTALCKAYNNIYAGPGTVLLGTAAMVDTSDNISISVTNAAFVNPAVYDYHLLASSPAINKGTSPGFANSFSLAPVNEYVHSTNKTARIISGVIDVGAHEYQPTTGIEEFTVFGLQFTVYPNPSDGEFTISISEQFDNITVRIYNMRGEIVYSEAIHLESQILNLESFPAGIYFAEVIAGKNRCTKKILIK